MARLGLTSVLNKLERNMEQSQEERRQRAKADSAIIATQGIVKKMHKVQEEQHQQSVAERQLLSDAADEDRATKADEAHEERKANHEEQMAGLTEIISRLEELSLDPKGNEKEIRKLRTRIVQLQKEVVVTKKENEVLKEALAKKDRRATEQIQQQQPTLRGTATAHNSRSRDAPPPAIPPRAAPKEKHVRRHHLQTLKDADETQRENVRMRGRVRMPRNTR